MLYIYGMRNWNFTARLRLVAELLALVCLTQSASASGASTVYPLLQIGQRVRVEYDTTVTKHLLYVIPWSSREIRKTTGPLVSWSSDTIVIASDQLDGQLRAFSEWRVRKLYMVDGRRRATAEGMGIGAAIIGLPMFIAVFGVPRHAESGGVRGNRFRTPLILLGGAALAGGIIGWFTKVDRWKQVEKRDWPFQLELSGKSGDFGVGLIFRF